MSAGMRFILTFILVLLQLARGQVPFPGECPEVKVVDTFDLDKYMGTWYEYAKYPFVFEVGQKCQQAVYKNLGNNTISVVNTGVYIILNKPHSTNGTAKVLAPGQLEVSFKSPFKEQISGANYLVLGTDYDKYAVVYNCDQITSFGHTKVLWILSREREPSAEAIQHAKEVMKKNNLSETYLMTSAQTNCPKIPESNATAVENGNSNDFSSTSNENIIENA